jgi:hypothetical protein
MRYDAVLERRPADYVHKELKAMEEAAEEARKERARQERGRKRDERKTRHGDATRKQVATASPGRTPQTRGSFPLHAR